MSRTLEAHPTVDSAKENLFNVLPDYIDFEDGIVALGPFADVGSISTKLVSCGCDRVTNIERDGARHAFISKIMKEVQTDKCLSIREGVFKFINDSYERFDFVFADPLYELGELGTIPDLVFKNNILKENRLFVLGHGRRNNLKDNPRFIERRVYGSINFSSFR